MASAAGGAEMISPVPVYVNGVQIGDPVPETRYRFVVRGTYADGNKAKMDGYVHGGPNFPMEVFRRAVAVCKELTPGLIVDETKHNHCVLTKLKGRKK